MYNILSYIYVYLWVLISYLTVQCMKMDNLKLIKIWYSLQSLKLPRAMILFT